METKRPTQKEVVLNYLTSSENASISQLEASTQKDVEIFPNSGIYGKGWYITDLAGVVHNLKKDGHDITFDWVTSTTGARFKRYKMSATYWRERRIRIMQEKAKGQVQLNIF